MASLSYREYPAAPALAALIAGYWCFRAEPPAAPTRHAVIPDGCISLVFARAPERRPAVVLGPRAEVLHVPIEPGACVFGVRFRPECGGLILGAAASELRELVVPLTAVSPRLAALLDGVVGAATEDAPVAVLGAALERWAEPIADARDVAVAEAVRAVIARDGRLRLADGAAAAGLGIRQFQRRFGSAVGLSFKEYARIRRFRAAALRLLVSDPPAAQLAASAGYADQSHLIRESARLAGVSPQALRGYLAGIRHGPLLH